MFPLFSLMFSVAMAADDAPAPAAPATPAPAATSTPAATPAPAPSAAPAATPAPSAAPAATPAAAPAATPAPVPPTSPAPGSPPAPTSVGGEAPTSVGGEAPTSVGGVAPVEPAPAEPAPAEVVAPEKPAVRLQFVPLPRGYEVRGENGEVLDPASLAAALGDDSLAERQKKQKTNAIIRTSVLGTVGLGLMGAGIYSALAPNPPARAQYVHPFLDDEEEQARYDRGLEFYNNEMRWAAGFFLGGSALALGAAVVVPLDLPRASSTPSRLWTTDEMSAKVKAHNKAIPVVEPPPPPPPAPTPGPEDDL